MNQEQLLNLCEAAHNAPSADNSQPWRFIVSTDKITIIYDTPRVLNKTFAADNIATRISMGSVVESIAQTCVEHKIKFTVDTSPIISNGITSYARFSFDQKLLEKFTLKKTSTASIRHTNRFAYKDQQPSNQDVEALIDKLNVDSTNIKWIEDRDYIKDIATLIKTASEIRFQTPQVHEWLMQSLRFGTRQDTEDGLHISTLDLPPLGGAFMKFITPWERTAFLNKVGMYKLMAAIEAQPISNAPGLMSFSCKNTPQAQLQAGRDSFKLWAALNKIGLAVHPYFVITDQITRLHNNIVPKNLIPLARRLEEETHKLFNLEAEENICMILRVGYPKKQAVRSRRLNFMDVVSIED